MRRGAFTLVELLVVLAVIALLATLLMGGLQAAAEQSRATRCTSNLRQLAAANFAYASEHEGQFVPAQDQRNLVRWHGVRTGSTAAFDPTKGPLAPYLGGEGRVKLCPSLERVLTGSKSFENGTGGYGYNAAYIGGTPRDLYTPELMARLEHPAQTVMFTDSAFARATGLQEYAFCEPWQTEDPPEVFGAQLSASVHFRHNGRANVAWCDGHVSAELPTKIDGGNGYGGDSAKYNLGWFGPGDRNGWWRPY